MTSIAVCTCFLLRLLSLSLLFIPFYILFRLFVCKTAGDGAWPKSNGVHFTAGDKKLTGECFLSAFFLGRLQVRFRAAPKRQSFDFYDFPNCLSYADAFIIKDFVHY